MSTWEERMSLKAKARMAAAEAAERANDPHREHHAHLDGTSVYCSCGEFEGITTVAFPAEASEDPGTWRRSLVCSICGQVGVVALGAE